MLLSTGTVKTRWSKRPGQTAVRVIGVSFVVAICYTGQVWFTGMLNEKPMPVRSILAEQLSFWLIWGVLAIPVLYLVHRFPLFPRTRRNWLTHIVAALLFAPLQSLLYFVALNVFSGYEASQLVKHFFVPGFSRNLIYYWLIAATAQALEGFQRASQLQTMLVQAQLQALKMQLHPHFLFNTLNSISALLREDVEAADDMIERLGGFLRLTLENAGTEDVSLREELDFMTCYLSIEQVRFRDRLTTEMNIETRALDARVPNLILQPIVENAIRHGLAAKSSAGRIEIRARRDDSRLNIQVQDDGPGIPIGEDCASLAGRGLGLSNTRERLNQLYGDGHRFELKNAASGGLIVELEIPFEAHIAMAASANGDGR